MKRFLLVLGFLCITAALTIGGAAVYVYVQYTSPSKLVQGSDIIIPQGAGVRGIAEIFQREQIVEEPLIFLAGVRVAGLDRSLRAGEYHFPARVSPRQAAEILASGETVRRFVTIPEGLRSGEIIDRINLVDGLTGDITDIPKDGTLLPETYQFSYGDTKQSIIDRMRAAHDALVDELWPGRDSELPFDTINEAIVLASIVERETGVAAERGRVAGVFVNRLNRNMRLQSDPTVAYAVSPKKRLDRALTRNDLRFESPYNTYVTAGLPPSPITNPGRDAIYAVLHPSETEDIYFVADGTGGHAFARTLDEHNRNVAKWRRLRDSQ
ncbi:MULTISPECIES: endolytic transglycosylase MltG [Thalassospira]|uniref:Endolytic murein transglycosylase n=1 Tax=Thalassospira lucentensis TaxID=168935 RepID=A0A358HND9_9PROT|nr:MULTISPECIES: endolytic transglycosylase MltG [Thalassospira]MBV16857.1 aminodeoxychorismate lyase [Thalassospira sp.]HBU96681.1 endolytic transglycosylase MltG [Thalassospira lucentensis]HCW67293.1 endolytic transglycosylase MltG [Thalassospira lucentensis]